MASSVKVVLIDTQYVKTDAKRFKSVVQSLTGKDASVEWIDRNGTALAGKNNGNAKRKRSSSGTNNHVIGSRDDSTTNKSDVIGKLCDDRNSMLSKMLSFKELDTILMELPSLEDRHFWLSNDFMD